jgi:hypothetical protein
MTELNAGPAGTPAKTMRIVGVVALVAVVLGLATLGTCAWTNQPATSTVGNDDKGKDKKDGPPTVGGLPLFHNWPKDRKPDAVVLLSGQSFGFLQPCGCSRPQQGGLERRAVFVKSLRDKGWTVAGFDLGDLAPQKAPIKDQALLKYKTMMNSLREMGYIAVGLGKSEFDLGVDELLAEYALQKEQPPFTVAANLRGVANDKPIAREVRFPPIDPAKSNRPLVGLAEIADVAGVQVGVVAAVGKTLADEVAKERPDLGFEAEGVVIKRALAALAAAPKKPLIHVLLYQGSADDAKAVAKDFPQFDVILCQAGDPEPPQFPDRVNNGKTNVIQVGHKGRYVGVVGVFKKQGGFDLTYQLIPLGEEYITAGSEEAARKANPTLGLLETYAEQVRDRNFLAKVPKVAHPTQIQKKDLNVSYVGSEKCQGCHAAESAKWKDTPHSHALDALEKIAKRPGLRNLDGECVVCHTVGLGYKTGYENQKAMPQLAHVGCESCHGPGSAHSADPKNADLLALMSPWRVKPGARLPDLQTIKKIGALPAIDRGKVPLKPEEQLMVNLVSSMCAKCHDHENDPHFDLYTYWPKVYHTFNQPAGGNGNGKN